MNSTSDRLDIDAEGYPVWHEALIGGFVLDAKVTHTQPIWLSYRLGSIESGDYAGSEVSSPGNIFVCDIKKNGEHIGTVSFSHNDLFKLAIEALGQVEDHG